MRKIFIVLLLIVFIISNWIMDITTWIHQGVKACGIFFCITNNNADLIYHIAWYSSIVICLYLGLVLLYLSEIKDF